MDTEGDPVQELSALAMDNVTFQIISVYHKHADCDSDSDGWARTHVHGLNQSYLRLHGFSNDSELLSDFQKWLDSLNVICIFANNPAKERLFLHNNIIRDSLLPNWVDRASEPYHQVANCFKDLNIPVHGINCNPYAHRDYRSPSMRHLKTKKEEAKALHGHHCSLYDAYELYLYHIMEPLHTLH